MNHKNGFTLLELLIAAAIIGTLMIFATQTFRRTSSDVRMQEVQARAKFIAMTARRFLADHPGAYVDTNPWGDVAVATPGHCSEAQLSLQNLVNCGYLEWRRYTREVQDQVGSNDSVESIFKTNFKMWFSVDGEVCFVRTNSNKKITDGTTYCTDGDTVVAQES